MFGVLNLNKPAGVTSRDCVNVVQRLVRPVKVGHAGTLDPMATGVLLVSVGPATKLISLLQQQPKTYAAGFRLGVTSDTDDSTGSIIEETQAAPVDREVVERTLQRFVGRIEQVPPAFSAVKVNGRRAYSKARKGEDFQLTARPVDVYRVELASYHWPELEVTIECGTGTYIRSIARDLGQALGCGGLMTALERTAIGSFTTETAITPDDLNAENLSDLLHDPLDVLNFLPVRCCSEAERINIRQGRRIELGTIMQPEADSPRNDRKANDIVLLASAERTQLLAVATLTEDGKQLQPRNVFDREPSRS